MWGDVSGFGLAAKVAGLVPESWGDQRHGKGSARGSDNDGMGPYGRPAENGFPLPEQPLWHGHAYTPEGVYFIAGENRFSDGYVPGPGDKPQF